MKHLFALTMVLSALSLLGCGGGGGDETATAEEAQTLTLLAPQGALADGIQSMVDDFKTETGISLTVTTAAEQGYEAQLMQKLQDSSVDLVLVEQQMLGDASGELVNLSDWLDSGAVAAGDIHPSVGKLLCQYPVGSGRYRLVPVQPDALVFAYRKDWFDQAGRSAPKTWEEVVEVAQLFHQPQEGRRGISFPTTTDDRMLLMSVQQIMWGMGSYWGDLSGYKVLGRLNTAGGVHAMLIARDLMNAGAQPQTSAEQVIKQFNEGAVAIAMAPASMMHTVTADAAYVAVPDYSSSMGWGMGVNFNVSDEQQVLAQKFLAFFTNRQEQWARTPGLLTADSALLMSPAFVDAQPYRQAHADSLDQWREFWNIPLADELAEVAQQEIKRIIIEDADPIKVLWELAQTHQQMFIDAGMRSEANEFPDPPPPPGTKPELVKARELVQQRSGNAVSD